MLNGSTIYCSDPIPFGCLNRQTWSDKLGAASEHPILFQMKSFVFDLLL